MGGGIEGKESWEGLAPVQFISSYFSVGGKQRARQTNDVYKSLFLINEHNESRKFQKKKTSYRGAKDEILHILCF